MWKVNADKDKTHEGMLQLDDPDNWYEANVRFDGCVHFSSFDDDGKLDYYIHICDLDGMIQRLQAIKTEAVRHFGEDWPL